MLAQESLHDVRGATDPPSPLRRLLDDAMYGTRGPRSAAQEPGRFAIAASWHRVVQF
jgi:hypothetical protein